MIKIKYESVKNIENENENIIKTYCNECDKRENAKINNDFKSLSEQEKSIANVFKWGFMLYLLIIILIFIIKISPLLFIIKSLF